MNNIKKIVDDPEWQALRQSMVGTWTLMASSNCRKLRNYLGNFTEPLKNRRVLNYLTGTAFRIGKIQSEDVKRLINDIKCLPQKKTDKP